MLIDRREVKRRVVNGRLKKLALPIAVPQSWEYKLVTLETGDYTVMGLKHHVCIERKGIVDLFRTLTYRSEKKRFMEELRRAQEFKKFYLWVQASLFEVLSYDGKYRGRSNNAGLVDYLFELSVAWGFEVAFADSDPRVAGRNLSSILMTYHKMASSGKIRVRKGPKYAL